MITIKLPWAEVEALYGHLLSYQSRRRGEEHLVKTAVDKLEGALKGEDGEVTFALEAQEAAALVRHIWSFISGRTTAIEQTAEKLSGALTSQGFQWDGEEIVAANDSD